MNKLYLTTAEGIYDRLDELLVKFTGKSQTVFKTAEGKPYIGGNPLFFSLSHSGSKGVIAISDGPVGVDLELYKDRLHLAVSAAFSDREQQEILNEADFLAHWTVREAYVKMLGKTLAQTLKSMEYYEGNLYFDGKIQPCVLQTHRFDFGIVTVCLGEKI